MGVFKRNIVETIQNEEGVYEMICVIDKSFSEPYTSRFTPFATGGFVSERPIRPAKWPSCHNLPPLQKVDLMISEEIIKMMKNRKADKIAGSLESQS